MSQRNIFNTSASSQQTSLLGEFIKKQELLGNRSQFGLGTIAVQNATAVAITGGIISGVIINRVRTVNVSQFNIAPVGYTLQNFNNVSNTWGIKTADFKLYIRDESDVSFMPYIVLNSKTKSIGVNVDLPLSSFHIKSNGLSGKPKMILEHLDVAALEPTNIQIITSPQTFEIGAAPDLLGIYMGIANDNKKKFFMSSAGRIGIGTNVPRNILDIAGGTVIGC
jgi:hypothetical protein